MYTPSCLCVYFRQITSAHVTTNALHFCNSCEVYYIYLIVFIATYVTFDCAFKHK